MNPGNAHDPAGGRGDRRGPFPATPGVSVLMPVYNERPAFLEQAVRSIARQTFADFEFLLVDDGSGWADTLGALARLAKQDRRIRLLREPHRGLTKALSVGLSLCRGEVICRQDADDWSEPSRLARQVRYLQENPATALVGSYAWLHQENGTPLWVAELPTTPGDIRQALDQTNPFFHGAVCFRKRAFEAVGGYRDGLDLGQDYDSFWRLCEHFPCANLPEPLYHYRYRRGSLGAAQVQAQEKSGWVIRYLAEMRRHGLPEDLGLALQKAAERLRQQDGSTGHLLTRADRLLMAGHYREALATYLRGACGRPLRRVGWLKLLRWGLFVAVPELRPWLFRTTWLLRPSRNGG
jgi:glycosyltransferase involved in cell wall biosynthesis